MHGIGISVSIIMYLFFIAIYVVLRWMIHYFVWHIFNLYGFRFFRCVCLSLFFFFSTFLFSFLFIQQPTRLKITKKMDFFSQYSAFIHNTFSVICFKYFQLENGNPLPHHQQHAYTPRELTKLQSASRKSSKNTICFSYLAFPYPLKKETFLWIVINKI